MVEHYGQLLNISENSSPSFDHTSQPKLSISDEGVQEVKARIDALGTRTGLMHIAAALAIPQIAIFGSSNPKHTPPLSKQAKVVWLGLACSPCYQRNCPLGHLDCLTKIEAEQVYTML